MNPELYEPKDPQPETRTEPVTHPNPVEEPDMRNELDAKKEQAQNTAHDALDTAATLRKTTEEQAERLQRRAKEMQEREEEVGPVLKKIETLGRAA